MGSRKRRVGLFDHAKYSQAVIRIIPDSVRKAVQEDIASIINPNLANTRAIPGRKQARFESDDNEQHQLFNNKQLLDANVVSTNKNLNSQFPQQSQRCIGVLPVSSSSQRHGAEQYFPQNPSFTEVRNVLLAAGRNKQPNDEVDKNKPFQSHDQVLGDVGTSSSFEVPLKKISESMLDAHPTITLRSNEPLSLTDASFSILRNALSSIQTNAGNGEANAAGTSAPRSFVLNSPYRTLSDQTVAIQELQNDSQLAEREAAGNFEYSQEDSPRTYLRSDFEAHQHLQQQHEPQFASEEIVVVDNFEDLQQERLSPSLRDYINYESPSSLPTTPISFEF